MASAVRFISSVGNGRGNYFMWRYHFIFFLNPLFVFFPEDNKMRA
jgi:hypothetical protein